MPVFANRDGHDRPEASASPDLVQNVSGFTVSQVGRCDLVILHALFFEHLLACLGIEACSICEERLQHVVLLFFFVVLVVLFVVAALVVVFLEEAVVRVVVGILVPVAIWFFVDEVRVPVVVVVVVLDWPPEEPSIRRRVSLMNIP